MAYDERSAVEVNVLPPKGEQLALTQSGSEGAGVQGAPIGRPPSRREAADLVDRQRLRLVSNLRLRVDQRGDVCG
jgi:hypothetical protein